MAPGFIKQLTQRLNPDLQILSPSPSASPSPRPPASPSPPVAVTEKTLEPIRSTEEEIPEILTKDFGLSVPSTPAPIVITAYKGKETTQLPSPSLIVPDSTKSSITASTAAPSPPTTAAKGKEPATATSPAIPSLITPNSTTLAATTSTAAPSASSPTTAAKGKEPAILPSPSLIVPDSTTPAITTSTATLSPPTTVSKGKEPATTTTTSPTMSSTTPSVRDADKNKPYFPLAGQAQDGYSNAEEATATCFCGAVQLAFPVEGPGLVSTFVCNCTDCRKITASMFASNFTVRDGHLKHIRGQENLKTYGQKETIASGHMMTNYFCQTCGTLMYRVGAAFPNRSILRLGTVDDFNLVETKLRPTRELFVKDRVSWFKGVDGEKVEKWESVPRVLSKKWEGIPQVSSKRSENSEVKL